MWAATQLLSKLFEGRQLRQFAEMGLAPRVLAFALLLGCALAIPAQIGGKTAADGPFTLDDAEDLDLIADGVGQPWISDFVLPVGDILSVFDLSTSLLILAPSQTPVGALRATVPEESGFIDAGFGVVMPAVVGALPEDFPGDITSFERLTFDACFDPTVPSPIFDVILESNASASLPRIFWNYTPSPGTAFQRVEIDLRSPDLILDAGSLVLEDLLGSTQFLFFNFFAGPVSLGSTLSFHIDDIRLEGTSEPVSSIGDVWLYR